MRAARAGWLLLLLAGCSSWQAPGGGQRAATVAETRNDAADHGSPLAYHARVSRLAGAELGREQEAARRAYLKARSDASRMRYALALAVPGATAADQTRALETLEPVTRNAASSQHGLALLVTAFLQEQRRLEAQAQGLQHKLDALLELERSMTGREGGAHKKR
jgi:hypothetical protein